ncbi:MAG: hypothetical protein CFE21_11190 [Bacteroidetes bacterium B1(2017)]|nr:MAG: hypothetical protein CFE21_11190 [Bacteroidetes bacterium B1(2017)]
MKKILLALIALSLNLLALAQKPECAKFKEGSFVLEDKNNGNTYISRQGKTQVEWQEYTKLKIEFTVKWIDECNYSLKIKKVLENPRNLQIPMDLVVNVKITSTNGNTYTQQSSSKGVEFVLTSEIRKIE